MKKVIVAILLVLSAPVFAQVPTYKATLTWVDNSTNETGFLIERNNGAGTGGADTPFTSVGQVAANVLSFVDQPIGAGETHCWRVKAFNTAGNSNPSPTACATAPALVTIPNAPGTLQVIITIAN
jgi:hypothetical protein